MRNGTLVLVLAVIVGLAPPVGDAKQNKNNARYLAVTLKNVPTEPTGKPVHKVWAGIE